MLKTLNKEDFKNLGWPDYLIWSILLLMSLGIGIYFAVSEMIRKRHSKGGETKEFLLGGRNMKAIPVACSLMASFFSAITLLGTPNEIYQHGVMYWFIGIAYVFNITLACIFFIPVFYNLEITSSYEYLGLRFSKANQIMGALAFIFQMAPYMGIVLYGPCLALRVVMPVNIWIPITVMAVVCTAYTCLGGLKAVVWTDVLQLLMMFTGMTAIIIEGSIKSGGIKKVFDIAAEHNRMNYDFSIDPRVRHSFWSLVIGGTFLWLGIYGINQTMVQRAIAVKTLKQSIISYVINLPGMNLLLAVVSLCGFVIFAVFVDCDPLKTKFIITKSDQLVPLFVSRFITNYPGVSGIFVAGILSGGLSTMSSGLNSLAAVTLQDIIMVKYKRMSDRRAAIISKVLVLVYGAFTLLFAYISSLTDKILQVALGLFGMMSGPVLGVFTLGMFFPFTNYKGAIAGHIAGQIMIFWMGFGYYIAKISKPTLEFHNNNCSGQGYQNFNETYLLADGKPVEGLNNFYAVSYMWYTFFAWLVSLVVGLIVSAITCRSNTEKVQAQFITPPLRRVYAKYLAKDERIKCGYENQRSASQIEISQL